MSDRWQMLFDRASAYEVTIEAIQQTLQEHRETETDE
jgi:hypothetical protein